MYSLVRAYGARFYARFVVYFVNLLVFLPCFLSFVAVLFYASLDYELSSSIIQLNKNGLPISDEKDKREFEVPAAF